MRDDGGAMVGATRCEVGLLGVLAMRESLENVVGFTSETPSADVFTSAVA